jgi:hypothetical protein
MEIVHPTQYSNLIEYTLSGTIDWQISNIPNVMILNKDGYIFQYSLFFPIFSETPLKFKMRYENHSVYLINHSKNIENISLSCSKTPKIIYFVNNSNAKLITNTTSIDLSDKKGKSFFINENSKINLSRSNNIQACIVILELKNIIDKKIQYQ